MTKQMQQSKWQIASAQITNLRWEIEAVLSTFSEDEKETERYKQLIATLDLLMEHILHKYRESEIERLKKETEVLKTQTSWMSWKVIAAAIIGGIATEVAKFMIQILAVILGGDKP